MPYLEKQLGANARIVVVNRGGAGGEIGFTAIANAPPDGYTIGFINSPATQAIPIERPAARYSMQSFDLIGNVVHDPASIAVHADSQVQGPRRAARLCEGESRDGHHRDTRGRDHGPQRESRCSTR